MKICDSVTTSTVRGRRPHFRDALIEEQILYFKLIWDLTLLLTIYRYNIFTTINHVLLASRGYEYDGFLFS